MVFVNHSNDEQAEGRWVDGNDVGAIPWSNFELLYTMAGVGIWFAVAHQAKLRRPLPQQEASSDFDVYDKCTSNWTWSGAPPWTPC